MDEYVNLGDRNVRLFGNMCCIGRTAKHPVVSDTEGRIYVIVNDKSFNKGMYVPYDEKRHGEIS